MTGNPALPSSDEWVESASALPVCFAQVREDARIDQRLIQRLGRPARVLMVASGGDTAALIATRSASLHLVDPSPAQLALSRLKLALVQEATGDERLAILGHTPMAPAERLSCLRGLLSGLGLPLDALGPVELIAEHGPDHCGRYERLFARLRELLRDVADEIEDLLSQSSPSEQSRRVASGTDLGRRLETAFEDVTELSKLVQLFGPEATANRLVPFSEHFIARLRSTLASHSAAANPFLHQILLGRFKGVVWPWLKLSRSAETCPVSFSCGTMLEVLRSQPDRIYDFVHLSNILDWVDPAEAKELLEQTTRCLSAGGTVVARQLNSTLDIPAASTELRWLPDLADELHRGDHSFFYRALHVGVSP